MPLLWMTNRRSDIQRMKTGVWADSGLKHKRGGEKGPRGFFGPSPTQQSTKTSKVLGQNLSQDKMQISD